MDDGEPRNPWTTLASQERYDNPWIRVVEHRVLNPAGKPGVYGTVHYKNRRSACCPSTPRATRGWSGSGASGPILFLEMPEGGGAGSSSSRSNRRGANSPRRRASSPGRGASSCACTCRTR